MNSFFTRKSRAACVFAACCIFLIASSHADAQFPASKFTGSTCKVVVENLDSKAVEIQWVKYDGSLAPSTRINAGQKTSFQASSGNNFVIRTAGDRVNKFRKFVTLSKKASQTIYVTPLHWVETEDLFVTFTSKFELVWHDAGSGADRNASFWRPIPPPGFYAVGDFAHANSRSGGVQNPNGKVLVAVVKEKKPGALKPPTGFAFIWNDAGSGADLDGSMWNMKPPQGYVALGSVSFDSGTPDVKKYRCVKSSLVATAKVGGQIWSDAGSGAKRDFSAWSIVANGNANRGFANLSAGTFLAQPNYSTPSGHPAANILTVPLPKPVKINSENVPEMTSFDKPEEPKPFIAAITHLPWFAVKDGGLSDIQKLVRSPVYQMVRKDQYVELLYQKKNDTDLIQTPKVAYTTGVSATQEKSFSETTGISMTAGYTPPGDLGGAHASVTLSYSATNGWSKSTTESSSTAKEYPIQVAPGETAMVYQVESSFQLYRMNGQQVGKEVSGKTPTVYMTAFPRKANK